MFVFAVKAQDIDAKIIVDASKIGQSNRQVFEQLSKSLNDFVNTTVWSNRNLTDAEKIKINFYLNISDYSDNFFKGSLQVQYSRPVYDAIYQSPVVLIRDEDFSFQYESFMPLVLNKNGIDTNLVSVFSYYIYLIIGIDADTFQSRGGSVFFREANEIANLSRSQNFSGWNNTGSGYNRIQLSQDLLSNSYATFRAVLYNYHAKGLDYMTQDPEASKQIIANAVTNLHTIYKRNAKTPLLKLFFDAKAQELSNLLSQGPKIDTKVIKSNLMQMAPLFANQWNKIN